MAPLTWYRRLQPPVTRGPDGSPRGQPGQRGPFGSIGRTSVQDRRGAARQNRGMRFDTKIAIAVREDLEQWQKLNVTAFLASAIAFGVPETARQTVRGRFG